MDELHDSGQGSEEDDGIAGGQEEVGYSQESKVEVLELLGEGPNFEQLRPKLEAGGDIDFH